MLRALLLEDEAPAREHLAHLVTTAATPCVVVGAVDSVAALVQSRPGSSPSADDLVDMFSNRFFFGCEADDRSIAYAFSKANPFGARLQPVFSSDLAHWDVEDMSEVVAEAFGLVRKGVLEQQDFREFVFENPARLLLDV